MSFICCSCESLDSGIFICAHQTLECFLYCLEFSLGLFLIFGMLVRVPFLSQRAERLLDISLLQDRKIAYHQRS